MHRQAVIAVLAAAVLVPGLQAQMRSGAGRGSVAARGSGRTVAPARAGFTPGRPAMPAGRHFGGAPGFHGGTGFGNHHFYPHHHRFVSYYNGCYGGYCYPGYAAYPAYYAPPIFSGFDYGASYGYGAQSYVPARPAYDDSALQVQIQHLTDEVEQLREEQQQRRQPPPAAPPVRPSRMDLPTILVFRDGRVTQVKNYAIVGQTLWLLDEQRAKKYSVGDLDLAATKGANDDRGGFALPQAMVNRP